MLELSFPGWSAAFTGREEGDLRIGGRSGGEPLAAVQQRVLDQLGLGAVVAAHQVHGAEVVVVERAHDGYSVAIAEADGVVTAARGLGAAVHAADCLPIAVGGEGAVAMLHGGWRGLAAGIIARGVEALRELAGESELQAVIGPGAGGCCYETGEEVRALFSGFQASRGRLLDLKAVAAAQLREAGVASVDDVGLCTICSPARRFFSHRRDGAASGRQGGFAWLS
jgi:YfiH family protein